jgi:hypothetical protein
MNRRALTRLTRKLAARRSAARRRGLGASAQKLKQQADVIKGLMA